MVSSPISTGFGGFTSMFLEMLVDEFPKHQLFTTAMMGNAAGWQREETEVRKDWLDRPAPLPTDTNFAANTEVHHPTLAQRGSESSTLGRAFVHAFARAGAESLGCRCSLGQISAR